MACACGEGGTSWIDELLEGGGITVEATDSGGETEGRLTLSWAALLGLLFALALIVSYIREL